MVARASIQHLRMDIAAHTLRKSFEKIVDQLALEIAHAIHVQGEVHHCVRASAQIYGCDGERLIHRHDEIAGAIDPAPCAERLRNGFTQSNAEVFDGVMLIDIEITRGADLEIERAVTRHQLEHVVEEADAGTNVVSPFSFDPEPDPDLGLTRLSVDYGTAHTTSNAFTAASV